MLGAVFRRLSWFERLLLLSPVVDVLTGVSHHYGIDLLEYASMTYRAGLLLLVAWLYVKVENKYRRLKLLLIACLLFVVANAVFVGLFVDSANIIENLNSSVRFWFFPLITIGLMELIRSRVISISVPIVYYVALMYSILLIIPTILGVYESAYPEWTGKFGSAGLFYEANEVGLILGLSFFGIFYHLTQFKPKIVHYLCLSVIIIATLLNGTKAPLFALLIAALVYVIYSLYYVSQLKAIAKNSILAASAVSVGVIGALYMYNLSRNPIYVDKGVFDTLILSGRGGLAQSRLEAYGNGSVAEKLVGTSQYTDNDQPVKLAEVDPVDLLYNSGVVGLGLYIFSVAVIIATAIRRYTNSIMLLFLGSGIAVALMSAVIMGHTLSSPSVIIVPIIYVLLMYSSKKVAE